MFKFVRTKASKGMNNVVQALREQGVRAKRNLLPATNIRIFPADKFVVNWGNSRPFQVLTSVIKVFNKPEAVTISANKLDTFMALTVFGVPHPKVIMPPVSGVWGLNLTEDTYIARTVVGGHSGQGCVVVLPGEQIPQDAKFCTKYIKPKAEYRCHVFGGKVILLAQKRRRSGAEAVPQDQYIRSWDNNWVFAVNACEEPGQALRDACIKATLACGLDFAGIDVVLTESGEVYVLEVNSAPGIEGQSTIDAYTKAFLDAADAYNSMSDAATQAA